MLCSLKVSRVEIHSVPCTGYPGGYTVSRGPSIFLDKKAKGRVPPLLDNLGRLKDLCSQSTWWCAWASHVWCDLSLEE